MVGAKVVVLFFFAWTLVLGGCGDLNPSGADKQPPAQNAPDFTLSDTLGNSVTLSTILPTTHGMVLYFTMWCPVCTTQMSNMQSVMIPQFPNVRFFAVDYVSGSVADARQTQISNGFAGVTVLADTSQAVLNEYQATMGTTVVIDSAGVIRMNEDYKDGTRLQSILAGLP
jgi:peroxiredoxin